MELWGGLNTFLVLFFLIFVPLYPIMRKHYGFFVHLVMGTIMNTIVSFALKYMFLVPRSVGFGPAFPSFHTQSAFFIATMMGLNYPKIAVLLFGLAGMVAIARVEKGVHSITDVIAGGLLGLMIGLWVYNTKVKRIDWKEVARQSIHLVVVLIVPISYMIGNIYGALIILGGMIAVYLSYKVSWIKKYTDVLERVSENSYTKAEIFLGTIFFVLLFFRWEISACAIIALCIGDAVSALIGSHLGHLKIWYNHKKTWEGTLFCFFSVYPLLFFIVGREMAIIVSLITAIIETLPKIDDNVAIPLVVVFFLKVMGL